MPRTNCRTRISNEFSSIMIFGGGGGSVAAGLENNLGLCYPGGAVFFLSNLTNRALSDRNGL